LTASKRALLCRQESSSYSSSGFLVERMGSLLVLHLSAQIINLLSESRSQYLRKLGTAKRSSTSSIENLAKLVLRLLPFDIRLADLHVQILKETPRSVECGVWSVEKRRRRED
jgi:hypothetical protein